MEGEAGARDPGGIDPIPRTLGKLTLLEQIGQGGMARIFLARAHGLGGFEKLVVVKQVLPALAEDAEFVERFFQEARLTATLDHPNIAAVYEVDCERGAYFYSMEYVRGRDLLKVTRRAKQRGRALRLDEIITVVTGLCAGLHHAHTRIGADGRPLGIVHRDVSPSNVLLSFDGAVKLADFGVAKARTGMVSTVAGTLRGKIAYMSPEQCRGESIDRRSDVYAVGALLWELIEGRRLHHADSEIGIVRRIAEGTLPDDGLHHAEATPALERIVLRALTGDPVARYPSAHALQVDLEEHARQLRLAVSARTLAALMHELFEEEIGRELGELAGPATTAFVRDGSGDERESATPATATLLPRIDTPAAAGATIERKVQRRRGWSTMAMGLALGAALASGALYFARDSPAPAGPIERLSLPAAEPSVAAAPVAAAPVAAAPVAAPPVAAPPVAAPPVAAAAPVDAPIIAPAEVEGPAIAPAPTDAGRERNSSRTRTKRKPTAPRERPLDLDAPLPPGFGDG